MTQTTDITMPSLSDSMEEGTILTWLVADGEPVAIGQELVELETDKATTTHPSEAEGILQVLEPEGTTVAVGTLIARIGVRASDADADADVDTDADVPPSPAPTPAAAGAAVLTVSSGPEPAQTALATPLARRIARVHEIALSTLAGSGPRGRITKADVLEAAGVAAPRNATALSATAETHPSSTESGDGSRGTSERVEPTRLQLRVARRMAEAKATIPEFQVQTEVEMDGALALRADLKRLAGADAGTTTESEPVPSLNDFVVKACALALRRHPRANGSYVDGGFELHGRVNVGFAVASEDALVVPVIPDADIKSLGRIADETRRLAERVRSGEIAPPELSGGTFTVSNLGMYGMTAITPVVNPPQAAILGVGSLREVLARSEGEIVQRTMMTLTLSCDHRILYGADAARFLGDIKRLLQTPLKLAL